MINECGHDGILTYFLGTKAPDSWPDEYFLVIDEKEKSLRHAANYVPARANSSQPWCTGLGGFRELAQSGVEEATRNVIESWDYLRGIIVVGDPSTALGGGFSSAMCDDLAQLGISSKTSVIRYNLEAENKSPLGQLNNFLSLAFERELPEHVRFHSGSQAGLDVLYRSLNCESVRRMQIAALQSLHASERIIESILCSRDSPRDVKKGSRCGATLLGTNATKIFEAAISYSVEPKGIVKSLRAASAIPLSGCVHFSTYDEPSWWLHKSHPLQTSDLIEDIVSQARPLINRGAFLHHYQYNGRSGLEVFREALNALET